MNWTKVSGYFILSTFLIIFITISLIVSDFLIFRIMRAQIVDPKSNEIITKRFDNDKILALEARKNGYSPLLLPDLFSVDNEFIKLADKFDIYPLGALPNKNTYFCNEGYGFIKYKSDRFGFRNDDKKWSKKEKIDVLILGDSFGHGACVEEDDTISGNLDKLKITNINLSISSNSAGNYAALADEFIPLLRPTNVVALFYRNDRYGSYSSILRNHFDSETKYAIKDSKGNLILSKDAENLFLEAKIVADYRISTSDLSGGRINFTGEMFNKIIDGFRRHSKLPAIQFFYSSFIQNTKIFEISSYATVFALDTLKNKCVEYNCKVTIFYLPESPFWDPDIFSDGYKNFLLKEAKIRNFRVIDANQFILKDDLSSFAPLGPHYSPRTYKKIATKISEIVNNESY